MIISLSLCRHKQGRGSLNLQTGGGGSREIISGAAMTLEMCSQNGLGILGEAHGGFDDLSHRLRVVQVGDEGVEVGFTAVIERLELVLDEFDGLIRLVRSLNCEKIQTSLKLR